MPTNAANYDESKIPRYVLPELLKDQDGTVIESAEQWERIRRPVILRDFQQRVYGEAPSDPESIRYRVDRVIQRALNGQATQKEIVISFSDRPDGPQMTVLLFVPAPGNQPAPAFLGLNFGGNHTIHSSPDISVTSSWVRNDEGAGIKDNRASSAHRGRAAGRWPVEQILQRGYALVTAYYGDIDPDFDDGFKNGVHSLYHAEKKPDRHEWGSISAWAWGMSRIMDYLEQDSDIDEARVAVIGHSRLGKTSLWAGARDRRFAMVISNNSGCGGAALSRRQFGETIGRINTSFPHWFCDNFSWYISREGLMPIDQHMLVALAAPRPIYVASATEDRWADPKGEFLAAREATPVYRLYGLEGIEAEELPEPDQSIGGHIGYHIRTGAHDLKLFDWERYLDFADRHFR